MKVGIIGYGYWGKNLARCLHSLGVLVAIADRDESALEQADNDYKDTIRYTDWIDLLASDVDAVAIASPSVSHFTLAEYAILSGKDVLVEKPMCLRVTEGEQLVDCASKNDRILMVGHVVEYHPAIVKLKEMVDAGELGNLRYIYSNRLNWGKFRTEENILWSFAPHDIALMLLLAGRMPVSADCRGGYYLNPNIADVTVSTLDFGDGLKGHIFVSWLHPYKDQKLVIIGDKAMAVFDDVESERKLVVYDNSNPKESARDVVIPTDEPLMLECLDFVECVETRRRPRVDGEKGLQVLRVLDMCQKSLNGREILI